MPNFKIHIAYNRVFAVILIIAASVLSNGFVAAQCTTPISTFPYHEDFETTDGNWFAGGVLSDWAWGIPSKTVINNAGSGQKCWITGGLTASFYNLGEQSWLQSPCFDFSSVQHPYINFKLFWETESRFDGTTLEYSTDNGSTWQILGNYNDIQNCLNGNWFNNPSIIKLPASQGWCGSIQSGDGSGAWVTAQHTLPQLAGLSKVIFRFFFGVGTVQNNYDGFAVDDINIGEAPPNNADFTFACAANNTVNFTNASANCPDSFFWDFDDAASGISNTSSAINPVHTFSGPGSYNVALTVSGPGNTPSSITKKISILAATAGTINNVSCNGGNNGSATVIANGSIGTYTYSWNTMPVQSNATAINLSPGTYTVTVSSAGSCSVSKDFVITQPPKLIMSLLAAPALCSSSTGMVTATVSGGTSPYDYSWTPGNVNAPVITNLAAGKYDLTVADLNGCMISDSVIVSDTNTLKIAISSLPSLCGNSNGTVTAVVSGGTIPYDYSWTPANVNAPVITNLSAGKYDLTVTDLNGCMITDSTIVHDTNTLKISLGTDTTICPGDLITLKPGIFKLYTWQDSSSFPVYTASQQGTYWVRVTDTLNCTAADTIHIINDCGVIYFPTAFTPNGDGRNEYFGPLGNLSAVQDYRLMIYDRWGQMVFQSADPFKKWDGTVRSAHAGLNTFTWFAEFTYREQKNIFRKGTVTVIR